jgi:6-phosphogluconolactonase
MEYTFYAGCYTSQERREGIHLVRFDAEKGKLSLESSHYGGDNPSFLIKKGSYLYAANESDGAGKASALSVDRDGALTYQGSCEAVGAGACHVAEMNGFLYGANYSSGSIFGVKILPDGSLGEVTQVIRHTGSGPNPIRQTKPYAHSVNPVANTNLLLVADLGADKLFCYRQQKDGTLLPDALFPSVPSPSGGGPRHMVIHPSGNRLYVAMEMGVSIAEYSLMSDGLQLLAEYPLLAQGFTESDSAADIHFSSDFKRLYASVRGQNLMSAFSVSEDGGLKLIGSYPTYGDCPRNFCLTAKDEFILVANQNSGNIVVCPVDRDTGAIGEAVDSLPLPKVACVIPA